jgi:hypothetical protein
MEAFSLSERKVHVSKCVFDTAPRSSRSEKPTPLQFFQSNTPRLQQLHRSSAQRKGWSRPQIHGFGGVPQGVFSGGGGGPPQSPLGQRWKKKRGRGAGGRRQPREPP